MKLSKEKQDKLKLQFKQFLTDGDTILVHKRIKVVEEIVYKDEFLNSEIKLTLTIDPQTGHVEIAESEVLKKGKFNWSKIQ